jgi:hypothetical protein
MNTTYPKTHIHRALPGLAASTLLTLSSLLRHGVHHQQVRMIKYVEGSTRRRMRAV